MTYRDGIRYVVIALCVVGLCASMTVNAELQDRLDNRFSTLVIAKVSSNPKKHYAKLRPLLDYVVTRLHDVGITQGEILFAKNNKQMIDWLRQGRVDWVTETPFSAVLFEKKARAELLVRRWRKGVSQYHTIFFARNDSEVNSLGDMPGHTIAFEDPGSTSAYFVPSAVMLGRGQVLTQLATPRERPPTDMVGYVFSKKEINTSSWVYNGLVDVGVLSSVNWENEGDVPALFKSKFKIIHQTQEFPRAIEVLRSGFDPKVKARLKALLLAAHADPAAKEPLAYYQKTTMFDEFNPQVQAGLAEARRLLQVVRDELN